MTLPLMMNGERTDDAMTNAPSVKNTTSARTMRIGYADIPVATADNKAEPASRKPRVMSSVVTLIPPMK